MDFFAAFFHYALLCGEKEEQTAPLLTWTAEMAVVRFWSATKYRFGQYGMGAREV